MTEDEMVKWHVRFNGHEFEQVRHGETTDNPVETYNESAPDTEHFLWLPIRNAEVESSSATPFFFCFQSSQLQSVFQ